MKGIGDFVSTACAHPRLTAWIAPSSWCFFGISALLTAYGLYYATAGRPFGRWKPLEL
jgi:hypothetical protein